MNRRQLLTTLTAIPLTTWAARLKTLTYNPKTSPLAAIAHKIKHTPTTTDPYWVTFNPKNFTAHPKWMKTLTNLDNTTKKLSED